MRPIFKLTLTFTCLLALFFVIGYAGIAFGAALMGQPTTAVLHDPSVAPLQAVNDVVAAWNVGWTLGVLVGVYLALELAAAAGVKNGIPKLAWLGSGRVSVAIAGATAAAAAIINSLATGAPWVAAIVAGGFALTSYWHPAGPASSSSSSAPPSSTPSVSKTAAVTAVLICALALPGCGGTLQSIENDIVDCTKGDTANIVQLLAGLAEAGLQYATNSDGSINTSTLKTEGLGAGGQLAGCLLADAFEHQVATGSGGSDAPKASPLVITPAAAAAAMAQLYPKQHFHTPHGDL